MAFASVFVKAIMPYSSISLLSDNQSSSRCALSRLLHSVFHLKGVGLSFNRPANEVQIGIRLM